MKNWSLSKKIWSVLALLCFAYVGSNGFAVKSLLGLKSDLNDITGNIVKRDQLTSEIKDAQRRISILTMESILIEDPAALKENEKTFEAVIEAQSKSVANYEALASEKGKAILAEYKTNMAAFLGVMKKTRDFGLENKNKEAVAMLFTAVEARKALLQDIEDLNDLTAKQLATKSEEANTSATQAVTVALISSIVSIVTALLVAFFVLRSLTAAIANVVRNLSDSSTQVSSAAAQIASSSEELSQAATEQAASLEETAASIEEMNSMVGKNSENANSAASTSGKSQEKATQGKNVVEKMISSMDTINQSNNTIMTQVNRGNESMAGIVKVIEEIGSKTKVINDIVFQTKLLSFNASVEAARAGEHGKGFAVVAEEVGNLAQMSGNAAKEISTLLDESIQKVNQIVQESKNSVERLIVESKETVEGGTEVARQCGEVLDEIVHNVSSVSTMAGEIASASQEQSRGVTEITKAMSQLDQMTQQNAATSEECASAAEELSAQAEALKNAVSQLVTTINGSNGQAPAAQLPNHHHVPVARKTAPAKTAPNVVHMKSAKSSVPVHSQPRRSAVGETPSYNGEGFEDV